MLNRYCQRGRCNPLNLPFKIMFIALICGRFPEASYTHCCRALTLALARLSCYCLRLRESLTYSVPTFVNLGCK